MIGARLRHERGWSEARILNISSRGLMVHAPQAPPRGTYIELSKGTHRIVARVVWVDCDRFGAMTQDAVAVAAMVRGDDAESPLPASPRNDRRGSHRDPPPAERHEFSRRRSQRLQFLTVTALGCAAAAFAFDTVRDTLFRPLNLVEVGLGGR